MRGKFRYLEDVVPIMNFDMFNDPKAESVTYNMKDLVYI